MALRGYRQPPELLPDFRDIAITGNGNDGVCHGACAVQPRHCTSFKAQGISCEKVHRFDYFHVSKRGQYKRRSLIPREDVHVQHLAAVTEPVLPVHRLEWSAAGAVK